MSVRNFVPGARLRADALQGLSDAVNQRTGMARGAFVAGRAVPRGVIGDEVPGRMPFEASLYYKEVPEGDKMTTAAFFAVRAGVVELPQDQFCEVPEKDEKTASPVAVKVDGTLHEGYLVLTLVRDSEGHVTYAYSCETRRPGTMVSVTEEPASTEK